MLRQQLHPRPRHGPPLRPPRPPVHGRVRPEEPIKYDSMELFLEHCKIVPSRYEQSLSVLKHAKLKEGMITKSSIMLGLGEKDEEINEAMADLRAIGVDILTLGQYLQSMFPLRSLPSGRTTENQLVSNMLPVDLWQIHLNTMIQIGGVVTRISGVFPQLLQVKYGCNKCSAIMGPFF